MPMAPSYSNHKKMTQPTNPKCGNTGLWKVQTSQGCTTLEADKYKIDVTYNHRRTQITITNRNMVSRRIIPFPPEIENLLRVVLAQQPEEVKQKIRERRRKHLEKIRAERNELINFATKVKILNDPKLKSSTGKNVLLSDNLKSVDVDTYNMNCLKRVMERRRHIPASNVLLYQNIKKKVSEKYASKYEKKAPKSSHQISLPCTTRNEFSTTVLLPNLGIDNSGKLILPQNKTVEGNLKPNECDLKPNECDLKPNECDLKSMEYNLKPVECNLNSQFQLEFAQHGLSDTITVEHIKEENNLLEAEIKELEGLQSDASFSSSSQSDISADSLLVCPSKTATIVGSVESTGTMLNAPGVVVNSIENKTVLPGNNSTAIENNTCSAEKGIISTESVSHPNGEDLGLPAMENKPVDNFIFKTPTPWPEYLHANKLSNLVADVLTPKDKKMGPELPKNLSLSEQSNTSESKENEDVESIIAEDCGNLENHVSSSMLKGHKHSLSNYTVVSLVPEKSEKPKRIRLLRSANMVYEKKVYKNHRTRSMRKPEPYKVAHKMYQSRPGKNEGALDGYSPLYAVDSTGKKFKNFVKGCEKTLDFSKIEKFKSILSQSQLQQTFSSFPRPSHLIGFRNFGNTCYLNSTLQALTGLTELCNLMKNLVDAHGMIAKLKYLLHVYSLGRDTSTALKGFRQQFVTKVYPQFNNYDQQDASEFLITLINQGVKETSFFNEFFKFKYFEEIKCFDCSKTNFSTVQDDYILNLVVPKEIPGIHNIQNLLKNQLGTCPSCKSETASCTYKFLTLPKVLVMVLKRYCNSRSSKDSSNVVSLKKIKTPYTVSQTIQVAKYTTRPTETISSSDASQVQNAQADAWDQPKVQWSHQVFQQYCLSGAVSHIGDGINVGHYLADVYRPEVDTWYHYSDEVVSSSNLDHHEFKENCYILFYTFNK